jgi:hypothetical protein
MSGQTLFLMPFLAETMGTNISREFRRFVLHAQLGRMNALEGAITPNVLAGQTGQSAGFRACPDFVCGLWTSARITHNTHTSDENYA